MSKLFKVISSHVESFHKKVISHMLFQKFCQTEKSFSIVTKLNKLNTIKKVKSFPCFDFATLYATILHNFPIKVLSEVMSFIFKSKPRSRLGFWKHQSAGLGCQRRYFTRQVLIDVISFLIPKSYFSIVNLIFKKEISIPISIDQAPTWTNLFQYFFDSKYIQQSLCKGSLRV